MFLLHARGHRLESHCEKMRNYLLKKKKHPSIRSVFRGPGESKKHGGKEKEESNRAEETSSCTVKSRTVSHTKARCLDWADQLPKLSVNSQVDGLCQLNWTEWAHCAGKYGRRVRGLEKWMLPTPWAQRNKLKELLISGCSAAQPPNYWRMRELDFEGDTAIKPIKHQLSDK